MKFTIDDDIFRIFPDLRIGIVLGRKLQIRSCLQELENLIEDNIKILIKRMDNKELTDFTNIKCWRKIYQQMGLNHNRYRPKVEALIQRVINGQNSPVINTAVNAYQAVEFLTMLPINGYDLAAVDGDICLRVSKGGELFKPLMGGDMEFTNPGEIIYSDSKTILSRYWNYCDCDTAKITENSNMIILASEAALIDINTPDLIETLCKIVEYEFAFCKGIYSTFILDKTSPEVELQ